MIELSVAVGRGLANEKQKTELDQMLKSFPDFVRDSKVIVDEARDTEDQVHFEHCLKMLFGHSSTDELKDFLTTCRRDRERWQQYCRLRYVFERVIKANKEFESMPEKDTQLPPKSAEVIWQKFQEIKGKSKR